MRSGAQVCGGGGRDVLGPHRADRALVAGPRLPAEAVGLVVGHRVRHGGAALHRDLVAPDQVAAGALELAGRHAAGAHPLELRAHPGHGGVELVGRAREVDGDEAGIDALDRVRRHAVGERALLAQLDEQPAALAAEDRDQHLEREPIGRVERGAQEADHEVRLRAIEVAVPRRRPPAPWPPPAQRGPHPGRPLEARADVRHGLVELDVADDREHEPRDGVALAVERREPARENRSIDAGVPRMSRAYGCSP